MITIMYIAQAPGGVERYLYSLLNNLDKTKYRNILVCSQSYDYRKFEDLVACIEIVEMYREINFLNDWKATYQVRKIIKKYCPDIVYMHSSKAGVIGRIANIGIKNISLYNAHGWAFNMECSNKRKFIYSIIEKVLALYCTKIIAISNFEEKSAFEWGICKHEKIKVIFNGIDFNEYKNMKPISRSRLGIPEDAFVVGTVGRLTAQKAPDIFVKAADKIKKQIPNVFFLMVGNGDQQMEIESLIRKENLQDRFLITGWVKNPMDYISCFDVATLLSRWEGFGLVLAEYMISGKPIVATRVNAIPDIITDFNNGLLVSVDNENEVCNAIVKLYEDTELRTHIISQVLLDYKRYDIKRVADEHDKLFKRLLLK